MGGVHHLGNVINVTCLHHFSMAELSGGVTQKKDLPLTAHVLEGSFLA